MNKDFKFRALRLDEPLTDGPYESVPLDSGIDGCRWHRIVLDADIPSQTSLTVSFYTSDREEEPDEWSGAIAFRNDGTHKDDIDVKDALVQAPPGRYIRVKIDFNGDGNKRPVLRGVKVYYQRISYLRYLPGVYQQHSESKDFLERFLSVFESLFFDTEETISSLPRYFDPQAAPEEFYQWLARWLSLDLYQLLGEKNREFILQAFDFYKQKGTVSGIANLVSFLTGKKCCVKEYVNNVFRSYGMEHEETDTAEPVDQRGCTQFYRKTSKTVDTSDADLLAKMNTYHDEMHYVIDTSPEGRYAPHVIGLFLFLSEEEEEFLIKEDELHKIINSFLPVFVRVEINLIEDMFVELYSLDSILDEYQDHIYAVTEEVVQVIQGEYGTYVDGVNWSWLLTCNIECSTNNLMYRTPHDKIGVEMDL